MKRLFATCVAVLLAAGTSRAAEPSVAPASSPVLQSQAPDFEANALELLHRRGRRCHPEFGFAKQEIADPRPLVWIVDGAGDLKGCSNGFSNANMLLGGPLELSVFPWSHGYRRLLQDQRDAKHARMQGFKLAERIEERAKSEPNRKVIVVAHSAGAAVALAAGDALRPGIVDRMILFAPSVSTGYDVRSTLNACKNGLDVFCSKKDWVALGFVTRVVGTVDKRWAPAAGRHGFKLNADECGLRHHFWSAEHAWTGHTGGHSGMHAPAFLHTYVFPLFLPPRSDP